MTYHNVYSYSSRTLWIAYGIAIMFTTLAVGMVLTALVRNAASYDSSFSTVVRIARGGELSEYMDEYDGHGQQPLPQHLRSARLVAMARPIGPEETKTGISVQVTSRLRSLSP